MTRDEYLDRFRHAADTAGFAEGHPQRAHLLLTLACDELSYRDSAITRVIETLLGERDELLGLPADANPHTDVLTRDERRVGLVEAEQRFRDRAERHSHGARESRR